MLKNIGNRAPDLFSELGLDDDSFIEKYIIPALNAKKKLFFTQKVKDEREVPDNRRRTGRANPVRDDRTEGKRGRKPASESRAVEIRAKLLTWKQTPESQRVSLRALALELGTSHQLLGSYLRGLDKWQSREYRRRSRAIRDLAAQENRAMTCSEKSQATALDRAATWYLLNFAQTSACRSYEAEFRGKDLADLTTQELRFLKFLAQQRVPFAQKLLTS
ncbi:MAG: hypothetical protein WBE47_14270 [Candidatus Acidiferrales bacterium]